MDPLAIVLGLAIAAAMAGIMSWGFFGSWREGYRILGEYIGSPELPQPDDIDQPRQPPRSTGARIAFVSTVVLIAVSGVFGLSRLLES